MISHQLPDLSIETASPAEKPVVARLLQLYLHDFSTFASADGPYGCVDDQGRFAYPPFERYWCKADHEVVIMRRAGQLAGFAMLNDWSASGLGTERAIAEFFILRKFRRTGLGRRAAIDIIAHRTAVWEIAAADYNVPAQQFWAAVVPALTGYRVTSLAGDGARWSGPVWRLTPRARS